MNKNKNLGATMLGYVIIFLFSYLILQKLFDIAFANNKNLKKKPLISRNFIDLNTPVYTNSDYKKNISQEYTQAPIPDDSARVNYFNSDLGNPLYPYN
jgi:hypothetical protein